MNTVHTLTDRYVAATLRSLPEKDRPEIERELRASIDDAVDARVDAGEPRSAAEEQVLRELGHPSRLAERYGDGPRYLIGPDEFPLWKGFLLRLVVTILPLAAIATAVAGLVTGAGIGQVIGSIVTTILGAGVHLAFWTTLVFALVGRSIASDAARARTPWDPSELPEIDPSRKVTAADAVASITMVLVAVFALFWQQRSSLVVADGEPVPALLPDNWSFWWPYFIVVLALEAGFAVVLWRRGRWSYPLVAANTAIGLLFAVPALWLILTDRLLNPAFFARIGDVEGAGEGIADIVTGIAILTVVVFSVWGLIDSLLKARRAGVAAQKE